MDGDIVSTSAGKNLGSFGSAFESTVTTENLGDVGGNFLADEFESVTGSNGADGTETEALIVGHVEGLLYKRKLGCFLRKVLWRYK